LILHQHDAKQNACHHGPADKLQKFSHTLVTALLMILARVAKVVYCESSIANAACCCKVTFVSY
jgi:hypothetical protein